MFFLRNDQRFLRRARRRVRGDRAAVFSEFAFLAPVLVMLISAMIEFASFWDARIMANHTAWTIGRQASVFGTNLDFFEKTPDFFEKGFSFDNEAVMKLLNPLNGVITGGIRPLLNRGRLTAALMMSTCSMGYFGASPSQLLGNFLKELARPVFELLTQGLGKIVEAQLKIESLMPEEKEEQEESPGFSFDSIKKKLLGWVNKTVIEDLVKKKALTPMMNFLAEKLDQWIEEKVVAYFDAKGLGTISNRSGRQLFCGISRVIMVGNIVTVREYGYSKSQKLTDVQHAFYDRNKLDFPQVFDKTATTDRYRVTKAGGWPPNQQSHGMIHVRVAWPFSTGWLFPVISGWRDAKADEAIRAVGSSYVFAQPRITNDNLLSSGATAFVDGDVPKLDTAEVAADFNMYLKMCAFAGDYRRCREQVEMQDGKPHASIAKTTPKYLKPNVFFYFLQRDNGEESGNKCVEDDLNFKLNHDGAIVKSLAEHTPDYIDSWCAITGQWGCQRSSRSYITWDGDVFRSRIEQHKGEEWLYIFGPDPNRAGWNGHDDSRESSGGPRHRYNFHVGCDLVKKHTQRQARFLDAPAGASEQYRQDLLKGIQGLPALNMANWASIYRGDGASLTNLEGKALKAAADVNALITKFERDLGTWVEEIRTQSDGGAGDSIDPNAMPEIEDAPDLSDPQAVKKWLKERIEKIKAETLPLYREIDKNVPGYNGIFSKPNAMVSRVYGSGRDRLLGAMEVDVVAALKEGAARVSDEVLVPGIFASEETLSKVVGARGFDLLGNKDAYLSQFSSCWAKNKRKIFPDLDDEDYRMLGEAIVRDGTFAKNSGSAGALTTYLFGLYTEKVFPELKKSGAWRIRAAAKATGMVGGGLLEYLRNHHSEPPFDIVRDGNYGLEALLKAHGGALEQVFAQYERERKYFVKLGSSSAVKAGTMSIWDLVFEGQRVTPDESEPVGSFGEGSDNDGQGDAWTRTPQGWRSGGK